MVAEGAVLDVPEPVEVELDEPLSPLPEEELDDELSPDAAGVLDEALSPLLGAADAVLELDPRLSVL